MSALRAPAGRRRLVGAARQAAGLGLVALLTVVLAQSTTSAAFTASASDTGNEVGSATDFCTAPGRVDTLSTSNTTVVDTAVWQFDPTANYSTTSTGVRSGSGENARTLIKFTLLSKPPGCVVGSASLRLRVSSTTASGTVQVYRAAAAWTAGTVNWNTAPGFVATTVAQTSTTAAGTFTQWNVAQLVTELYAGPDHGFLLKDAAEDTGGGRRQIYDSAEAGTTSNRPTLTITWV